MRPRGGLFTAFSFEEVGQLDDFYKECQEKVKNSTDPASTIDELLGISIHDLPTIQLCQFAEQAITLLSTVVQSSTFPTQGRIARFRAIRRQLDMTLNYVEQLLEIEKEFPPPQEPSEGCWW